MQLNSGAEGSGSFAKFAALHPVLSPRQLSAAQDIAIRRYHSAMDAQPELALLAKALNENRLEAILIGNMAAALHGAPVSTIDIDLYFRKTPANMRKLKQVASALEAVILRPYYPVSAFSGCSGIAMGCG